MKQRPGCRCLMRAMQVGPEPALRWSGLPGSHHTLGPAWVGHVRGEGTSVGTEETMTLDQHSVRAGSKLVTTQTAQRSRQLRSPGQPVTRADGRGSSPPDEGRGASVRHVRQTACRWEGLAGLVSAWLHLAPAQDRRAPSLGPIRTPQGSWAGPPGHRRPGTRSRQPPWTSPPLRQRTPPPLVTLGPGPQGPESHGASAGSGEGMGMGPKAGNGYGRGARAAPR